MKHPLAKPILVVAATSFLLLGALSQVTMAQTTGKIVGYVYDVSTGDPMIGVNVVVEGTTMGSMTNDRGYFFILNVPVGEYNVRSSFMGFKPTVISNADVDMDLTTELAFYLEETVLEVTEEILVEAERPLVQKDLTTSQNTIEASQVVDAPVDNYATFLNYSAGATRDIRGTHIRGGRATENVFYIDGVPIQDVNYHQTGSAVMDLNEEAVEEMTVLTGGFNAEYGNAQSAIINIATKEGGSEYHGKLEYQLDFGLEDLWTDVDEETKYDTGEKKWRASFGGPVPEYDKLRFFLSLEDATWNDWDPHVHILENQGRDDLNGSGRLTWQIEPEMKLSVSGAGYDAKYTVWDDERQFYPETFRQWDRETWFGTAEWNHLISPESFYNASFSMFETTMRGAQPGKWWDRTKSEAYNTSPHDGVDNDEDGVIDEDDEEGDEAAVDNLPVFGIEGEKYITGGDNRNFDDRSTIANTGRLSFTSQIDDYNQIKVGGEFTSYTVEETDVTAYADNVYNSYYKEKPRYGAFYAQDKMEWEGLIVNLGVRIDMFDANKQYPENERWPVEVDSSRDWVGTGPDLKNSIPDSLVDTDIHWQVSPRLGISHPITNNDVLHFTYGHYFQQPAFNYLYENSLYNIHGYWLRMGNANLEPERTISYEVGVEHAFGNDFLVDLTGFYKDIDNMVDTRTVNEIGDEDTPESAKEYTTYTNADFGNVRGFEIYLKKRYSGNWAADVNYTFLVARGISSDWDEGYLDRFDDNIRAVKEFYLDWDRRHTVTANFGYKVMDDWGINIVAQYASGSPYSDPQDKSEQPVKNTERFPPISTMDLRVNKDFALFGLKETVFIEVNNMFNKQNLVNFDDTDADFTNHLVSTGEFEGPFNDVTVYDAPRVIRGGLSIAY